MDSIVPGLRKSQFHMIILAFHSHLVLGTAVVTENVSQSRAAILHIKALRLDAFEPCERPCHSEVCGKLGPVAVRMRECEIAGIILALCTLWFNVIDIEGVTMQVQINGLPTYEAIVLLLLPELRTKILRLVWAKMR